MVQNSCWQSKSHKVKAFTLLESLLASLSSVGITPFSNYESAPHFRSSLPATKRAKEWLLFVDQLEAELDRSQFEKVEGNRLYMKQDGKDIAIGKSKSDDFRKTDASGRGISLWFMASNQLRLQRTINWFIFVSSFKRLRKGVHLSCGKRRKLRQVFSSTQSP